MRKASMTLFLVCILSLPLVVSSLAGQGGNGNGQAGGNPTQPGACEMVSALPIEPLSVEEAGYVILIREEEKLARDVYRTLYDEWGLAVFAKIAASEQRHMDAVGSLIEKYVELEDPVTDDSTGVFNAPEFDALYNDLVSRGSTSVVEALQVGATIEDLDIGDLLEALEAPEVVNNADIQLVFQNLLQGSAHHYAAFTRLLDGWDSSYRPQTFDTEELETVLSSLPTRGRGGKGPHSMSRRGAQTGGLNQGQGTGGGPRDGSCQLEN